MAKKEKIKEEQEKLKQRRQYNIDHNLPSEELKDVRKQNLEEDFDKVIKKYI